MAFQGDSIYWVEVEKVVPNPFQPRVEFHEGKLQELAESIRMYGVLQPLTVTRSEVQRDDGTFYTKYELIAGERRLRASKLAGVAQVPVIIREGEENEQEKLELAIIENLQREDLNAVDRALAFKQLSETFGLSHVQVAKKMGRSREYVSNSIRLLGLPEHMLNSLKHAEMMEGHARTLLMLTDRPEEQEVVYKEILLKKLSVREVERIVRKIATDKVRKKRAGDFDENLISLEKRFTDTLGTRVQIQKTDFGGKLTIDYFSEEDLEIILKRMREEAGNSSDIGAEAAKRMTQETGLDVQPPTKAPERLPAPAVAVATHEHSAVTPDTPLVTEEDTLSQYVSRSPAPVDDYVPSAPEPNPVPPPPVPTPPAIVAPVVAIESAIPAREAAPTQHTPIPLSPEYATPTPVAEPIITERPKESFFRHAVTDLFGRAREAQTYEAHETSQVPDTNEIIEAPVEDIQPTPAPKKDEVDSDDGDLYSVRNFSV